MKILLLSKYSWKGASSRYRTLQFIPYLEDMGVEITSLPLLDDEYLDKLYLKKNTWIVRSKGYIRRIIQLRKQKEYDLIWLEKELLPWIPGFIENMVCKLDTPYLVDYDDAIFHLYDLHRSSIVRGVLNNKLARVMEQSTIVIAGNEYLGNYALEKGARRVEVVPTVIDLTKYPIVSKKDNEELTIGWIGSSSTMKYLNPMKDAIEQLCHRYDAKLIVIGEYNHIEPGSRIRYVKWNEQEEVKLLQECDIGIMPLIDGAWERGKCGFKLIQYMGCMLPVVASNVGANKTIVDHGYDGYLASTLEEWERYLEFLLKDSELRKIMGERGRKKVEAQYSIQAVSKQMHKVIIEAVGSVR